MNLLVVLLAALLIGVVFALVVFIPPVRRFARTGQSYRLGITLSLTIVTMVACAFILILFSRTTATLSYTLLDSNCGFPPPTTEEEQEACERNHQYYDDREEIVDKLTVRNILPPVLLQPCVSDNPEICEVVEATSSNKAIEISCASSASLT